MTTREATSLLPRIGDTPSSARTAARSPTGRLCSPSARSSGPGWCAASTAAGSPTSMLCSTGSTFPTTPCPISAAGRRIPACSPSSPTIFSSTGRKLVVEFGTGASTLILARALQLAGGGRLISFDQHEDFVDATRALARRLRPHGRSARRAAAPVARLAGPLVRSRPAADGIDLMLIDGPPWTIHPMTRGGAVRPVRSDRAGRHGDARRRRPARRALRRAALAQDAAGFRLRPARQRHQGHPGRPQARLEGRPLREAGRAPPRPPPRPRRDRRAPPGGPARQRRSAPRPPASGPSARISTLPSRRLRTQPPRPSSAA